MPHITVSRSTWASYAPIPMYLHTDQGAWELQVGGPDSTYNIPGNRILDLRMGGENMYAVYVVADGVEYPYYDNQVRDPDSDSIVDISSLDNVYAITISDGFMYPTTPPCARSSCTYRGSYMRNGRVYTSGMSILAPCPPPPPPGMGPYM